MKQCQLRKSEAQVLVASEIITRDRANAAAISDAGRFRASLCRFYG